MQTVIVGPSSGAYDHERLIEFLKEQFPALIEELEDDLADGLLHIQMGAFARFTQSAIDEQQEAIVRKCFEVASAVFRDCSPDVKNAVYVSYLEHLNFTDGRRQRSWAQRMMPPPLRQGWRDIDTYLNELFEKACEKM